MNSSVILRIASDPVARVWSGVGWLDIPADAIEPDGARYLGGGQLLSIPELDQLINGTADRITITVSGVSGATIAAFVQEKSSLINARVDAGKAYFDDDWQLTEIEWVGQLRCDAPSISDQPSDNGRTRSISLSLGTDFTDRNIAPIAFFTPADQRRRSPDDTIFDHVPGITTGTSRPFAPSDA